MRWNYHKIKKEYSVKFKFHKFFKTEDEIVERNKIYKNLKKL